MRKVFDFIKRNRWVWIILLVLIAIIGDAILMQQAIPSPTPTPVSQIASYKNVAPGISSETDLNKIWGTPTRTTLNGQEKINEYKGVGFKNQTAIIENNKVQLIREVIGSTDTTKASSITSVYGTATTILYSKFPNYVFQLYVYPANGIAYLGAPDGTLSEIWYFAPTTSENFLNLWGQDFQTAPPAEQLQ